MKKPRGNQKIPRGKSEDTKGVIRRYQRGNQKIPRGQSEDTKGVVSSDYPFGIF
jgi:hypothetical protein